MAAPAASCRPVLAVGRVIDREARLPQPPRDEVGDRGVVFDEQRPHHANIRRDPDPPRISLLNGTSDPRDLNGTRITGIGTTGRGLTARNPMCSTGRGSLGITGIERDADQARMRMSTGRGSLADRRDRRDADHRGSHHGTRILGISTGRGSPGSVTGRGSPRISHGTRIRRISTGRGSSGSQRDADPRDLNGTRITGIGHGTRIIADFCNATWIADDGTRSDGEADLPRQDADLTGTRISTGRGSDGDANLHGTRI